MLMHFHLDLLDYYRGGISIRRLNVLVWRLLKMHGRSAVAEALLGEQARWGNAEYILADIADRLDAGNFLFIEANKAEGTDNPMPKPYPRPGVDMSMYEINEDATRFASNEEIVGFLSMLGG